jgi:D-alanyl-lipoteichoic acid acyltransferase DltB (MBOAT superfamily)
MQFNSFCFLIFFIFIFISYWFFFYKKRVYQNLLLLIGSYFFYGFWDWRFISLIIASTISDFILGIKIYNSKSKKQRKKFLILSISFNLGLLFIFKYFNFFISSFEFLIQKFGLDFDNWSLSILLPVGISFYTFQTLSYSIDIYQNKIKPTKDIISFAAFVAFFPQLVAGPIERASRLLPQFLNERKFNSNNAINGISLVIFGLFKKIVIADRLAIYVNSVFSNYQNYDSVTIIIASIFFSFQIYCDFSGYSHIARGISKLLGFELMINFNRPYLAQTFSDFWHRWHISLSTWFRDYIYIPFGGNRINKRRTYLNIMIVFTLSGLWHGANWNFIFWGFLHGIILIFFNKKIKGQNKISKILNTLFVFSIINLTWIFFRSENITVAFNIIYKLLDFDLNFNLVQISASKGPLNLLLSFLSIILLLTSYLLPQDLKFKSHYKSITFNSIIIFLILILGVNEKSEFIYFQF